MAPVLLLTGFEPFAGDGFNPSGRLARDLHGHELPGGAVIHGQVLPVSGPPAFQKLSLTIRRVRPHWIIAMGVSGRAEISLESTAWNEDDFRIPDNAGRQPRAEPILSRGPDRLETGFARQPWFTGENGAGLPIRSSNDPGRFVCNHLYYRLLHLTKNPAHPAHGRTLFLHLPCTLEMQRGPDDARFFHPLPELRHAVRTILERIGQSSP